MVVFCPEITQFPSFPGRTTHVLNAFCDVCSLLNVGTFWRIVDSLQVRRRQEEIEVSCVNPFIKKKPLLWYKVASVSIVSKVKYHISFICGLLSGFRLFLTHEYSLWSFACKSSLQNNEVKQCLQRSETMWRHFWMDKKRLCVCLCTCLPATPSKLAMTKASWKLYGLKSVVF